MSRLIKFTLFAAIFACLFSIGFAQNPSSGKGKPVKWEAVNGKDNEFALYMPEGFTVSGSADYYLGGPSGVGARIDRHVMVMRYLNGVVLMMNYYDGNGKQAQKILEEREKLTFDKEEEINGFLVKRFAGKVENRFHNTQQFLFKNRLYVVKSIAATENDQIVKGFFASIRLTNQTNTIAPNAAAGATTTSLPLLTEREQERVDDSKIYPISEVDRKPIILKMVRPAFPRSAQRNTGRVKLKVLFSSSGTITSIEIAESTSSRLVEEASIQAAKGTIFIPAEKDGKLVSVYNFIEHHFDVR